MEKYTKKLIKLAPIFLLTLLSPMISFAAVGPCEDITGLGKVICQLQQILNALVPFLISLGVVYFIWSVVNYVIADGEEAKKQGKERMIYGVIGFAVIFGLSGLVNIVVDTFGLTNGLPDPDIGTCKALSNPNFSDLLSYITCMISNSIIPLIFAIAGIMFIWGVVNFFIINADEEAKRAQGKQFMIWGIIALAVMMSVWSLVGIFGATFGLDTSVLPKVCPSSAPSCN